MSKKHKVALQFTFIGEAKNGDQLEDGIFDAEMMDWEVCRQLEKVVNDFLQSKKNHPSPSKPPLSKKEKVRLAKLKIFVNGQRSHHGGDLSNYDDEERKGGSLVPYIGKPVKFKK